MACACVSPVYLRYIDSLGQQPDRLYLSTSLSWSSSSIRTPSDRLSCDRAQAANIDSLRCRDSDISTVNLTVASRVRCLQFAH
jgi:hypothetical protein